MHRHRNQEATDVDDIWLRYSPDVAPDQPELVQEAQGAMWHKEAAVLGPAVRQLVLDVMRLTNSYQLDRLLITRIPPGGQILPHADVTGAYVHLAGLGRYHAVIQGLPGSMFYCGGEGRECFRRDNEFYNKSRARRFNYIGRTSDSAYITSYQRKYRT